MTKAWIFAGGLLAAVVAGPANAQAARHFDCSKAGNATKAACKGTKAVAPAKAAPVANPNACRDAFGRIKRCGVITPITGPIKPISSNTPTERNYDCSKPGNANKTACKKAAVKAAPVATATRHYDCSKAGNANKAVCKGTAPAAPTVAHTQPRATATVAGQNPHPGGPNGATAKCRDGTMSSSAHRAGTCSRHGGVAQWY